MRRVEGSWANKPAPLSIILLLATAVHLPLLLMGVPLNSYDTNFHIFFSSHYAGHWFAPWNPKWYAGFSQMTYPPLPHQVIALLSHVTGLDLAYMLVQFLGILLLAIGVYRFAQLWVDRRAASLAALAAVLLASESFLVYAAGQLSTTFAAPLYLNALPYIYEWLRYGRGRSLLKGTSLAVAAAAAHHATLIFGSFLFALPVFALAIVDARRDAAERDAVQDEEASPVRGVVVRGVVVSVLAGVAIAVVLLPFWIALIHNPVTQVPIPHPSRANYILSPHWGINYFVVPYGALILALPFIFMRGCSTPRLRPLFFGFWLAFLLGLGSTTPLGSMVLGRAFEVVTMERFTYWATLLALPMAGLLAKELLDRFGMKAAITMGALMCLSCAGALAWATYRPADAVNFKVDSVAAWLNRDGHDKYRYVTLGFGNKIARLAVLTDASSVDGEWNSGRTLPELTANGAGALTSSKYFGQSGIDALSAILHHADHYGLKWVFLHDPYYEPLLVFAGWRKVDDLEDRTITVWSKEGVPPATPVNSAQMPPDWQGIMWGILPIGSGILALLVIFIPDKRRHQLSIAGSYTGSLGDAVPEKRFAVQGAAR